MGQAERLACRERQPTRFPGGSPDPLCAARGPIFRKSAGHSSCRISVPDAQYKEKTFFLSAIVPLFGRVSGCVPSCGEGQHPCPSRRFRGGFGPISGGASEEGKMGPPAKPSGAGSLGRGGTVERVSFRPSGAETRDVELATTRSRRKPWRFYGAWAVTSARSAGGFGDLKLALFRPVGFEIGAVLVKKRLNPRRCGISGGADEKRRRFWR